MGTFLVRLQYFKCNTFIYFPLFSPEQLNSIYFHIYKEKGR